MEVNLSASVIPKTLRRKWKQIFSLSFLLSPAIVKSGKRKVVGLRSDLPDRSLANLKDRRCSDRGRPDPDPFTPDPSLAGISADFPDVRVRRETVLDSVTQISLSVENVSKCWTILNHYYSIKLKLIKFVNNSLNYIKYYFVK